MDSSSIAHNRKMLSDILYPIGSIYISVNSTSPSSLFGGVWEQIQNTFLLAAGSSYTAGSTGGEATHTLIESEIPSHTHRIHTGFSGGNWVRHYFGFIANVGNDGQQNPIYDEAQNRTTATGGGAAHNNMPPYLAVYMWKRTG